MDASQYALARGMRDTRATLLRWNAAPWGALRPWLIGAAAIAAGLLAATFVTVGIAAPVLVLAAFTEVYVSPHVILWLRG
jgi:hypothetical protein